MESQGISKELEELKISIIEKAIKENYFGKTYKKKLRLKKKVKYAIFGITNLIILLNIPLLVGKVNSYGDYVRIMIGIIIFIVIDTIVLYRIEK